MASGLAPLPGGIIGPGIAARPTRSPRSGDSASLVHGGWPRRRALLWNLLSALTFPLGGVVAWLLSRDLQVAGFVLFAAGNFIYIAASDLIPEIKEEKSPRGAALHLGCFLGGVLLMYGLAVAFQG